jgi:hypothetical protein
MANGDFAAERESGNLAISEGVRVDLAICQWRNFVVLIWQLDVVFFLCLSKEKNRTTSQLTNWIIAKLTKKRR